MDANQPNERATHGSFTLRPARLAYRPSLWLLAALGYAFVGCTPPNPAVDHEALALVPDAKGPAETLPDAPPPVSADAEPAKEESETPEPQTPRLDQPIGTVRSSEPLPVRRVSDDEATREFWNVIKSYQTARAYSDQAQAVLRYRDGNQVLEDRAPLSVRWQAPDRIEVVAYDAKLKADGRWVWAWVEDKATNHYDGQVARRKCPSPLTLEEILKESIWAEASAVGLAGPPPQLTWLFVPPPESQRPPVKALAPGEIDQRTYKRFSMGEAGAERTYWVDARTGTIRRIELPSPPTPGAAEVQLSVELLEASFTFSSKPLIDDLPKDHRLVTALIPPPSPIGPLIGNRPGPFKFASHDGRTEITQNGTGRPVVLAWFANHPASQEVVRALQRFADDRAGKVDVLAVMAEPQPQRDTGDLLRSWHVGLPWTNDTAALGRDVFRIQEAPTLLVMDKEGVIQFVASRWSQELIPSLAAVTEALATDRNPGKETRAAYERAMEQYRRQLDAMTIQ